jgi:GTP pyrophosphokinase
MKTKSDIRRALEFMIEAHNGQFRKFSGEEYAWHPVGVAKIVRNLKSSKNKERILIAALLHDTVEDTDVTLEVIENKFGEMVSSIVYELTSDGFKIKEIGKANYLLNKMLRMTSYALVI